MQSLSSLLLLEELKRTDIDLLCQLQLSLLISNKLIVEIHEDPSTCDQLGIEHALLVEEGSEPDELGLCHFLEFDNVTFIINLSAISNDLSYLLGELVHFTSDPQNLLLNLLAFFL